MSRHCEEDALRRSKGAARRGNLRHRPLCVDAVNVASVVTVVIVVIVVIVVGIVDAEVLIRLRELDACMVCRCRRIGQKCRLC